MATYVSNILLYVVVTVGVAAVLVSSQCTQCPSKSRLDVVESKLDILTQRQMEHEQSHDDEIKTLIAEHKNEIKGLVSAQKYELGKMADAYFSKINHMSNMHQQEMATYKMKIIDEIRDSHEKDLTKVRQDCKHEIWEALVSLDTDTEHIANIDNVDAPNKDMSSKTFPSLEDSEEETQTLTVADEEVEVKVYTRKGSEGDVKANIDVNSHLKPRMYNCNTL
jgi:hypothetical protein